MYDVILVVNNTVVTTTIDDLFELENLLLKYSGYTSVNLKKKENVKKRVKKIDRSE